MQNNLLNQEKLKLKNTTNQLFKSQPMQLFGCSGPVYVGRICGGSAGFHNAKQVQPLVMKQLELLNLLVQPLKMYKQAIS